MNERHVRSLHLFPIIACLMLAGCFGDNKNIGGTDGSNPPPGGSQPPPASNSPPTISGTPPTSITVGQSWSFQPTISDPDGDSLTVSASNLPSWLSLNSSTGRVQGTPGEGDVRTWSGISLTVSDGQATASLSPFSVNVIAQGAATGSATLSWMPPTERVDGSPIGELAGYEVLWGQTSRDYDNVVELDAGITRYFISGLGPGTWYFAIRSKTADGLESQLSQEVSKTI
jgi:hypothetical protein